LERKDTEVIYPEKEDAIEFIKRYHYSNRATMGKNIYFGWMVRNPKFPSFSTIKMLYAVANYGKGINPHQAKYLSRKTGFPVNDDNLLELKRLCRVDPRIDCYPLTAFLSRCHKLLRQKGYRYIVAFSDPDAGHHGGIYRAANFTHLGQTNQEYHAVDQKGNLRHRRQYYRYARSRNLTMKQARDKLGLRMQKTSAKDRWFIRI